METTNILSVLERLMKESYIQCEWAIEWQEDESYINIILQFNLPNEREVSLSDVLNRELNYKEIPFETRLVFYDKNLIEMHGPNYIASIPVDPTQGIAYGELVAIVKYLKVLVKTARINWSEFINDSSIDSFDIKWNQDDYLSLRQRLIDSHRYSDQKVYFPK